MQGAQAIGGLLAALAATVLVTGVALLRVAGIELRQPLARSVVYWLHVAVPLAAVGWVSPWLAGVGMSGSSLLVVVNALRLRRRG